MKKALAGCMLALSGLMKSGLNGCYRLPNRNLNTYLLKDAHQTTPLNRFNV